ncbi:hypothetical protein HMN09_00226000 [Mycena chlorophos]|uniref:XPG-I domain-containing protein n=1 Tax=Mycena chlorophos TaxID=658473 RepID=A0A8H6WIJ7_MYCCL|nr:hypothetical protein HMN09_00226000 [Mycena chlorophos]
MAVQLTKSQVPEMEVLSSSTAPQGALRPTTSNDTGRYEKTGIAEPSSMMFSSAAFTRLRMPEPEYLPQGWSAHIHPEGQLYFARAGAPRVVTEAYMYRKDVLDSVLSWVKQIEDVAFKNGFPVSPHIELFLKLEDDDDCAYYFVDHSTRAQTWMEDIDTEDLGLPAVVSVSQLNLICEELYWSHVEHFPMHLSALPVATIDSLICVFTHAMCDQMTSRVSTFPYSKQECESFLSLLKNAREHSCDGNIICTVARLWSLICRNRYLTFYGEEFARLSRDQAVLYDPATKHEWISTVAARVSFQTSSRYLQRLNDVFVDRIVYAEQWGMLLTGCLRDWRSTSYEAFFGVIDGTLITQRLHFAPVPHAYRHVLGWYRLVKEFQEAGVTMYCVFDGDERSVAKARETERRRAARRLTLARAAVEVDRMRRLQQLATLVQDLRSVVSPEDMQLSELFGNISSEQANMSPPATPSGSEDNAPTYYSGDPFEFIGAETLEAVAREEVDSFGGLDLSDALHDDDMTIANDYLPNQHIILDDYTTQPSVSPPLKPLYQLNENCPSDPSTTLTSLYSQFRGSVNKLSALASAPAATSTPVEEVQTEYSLSKRQLRLTADETKFWAELASDSLTAPPSNTLQSLTARAAAISESYQRRTNPPTTRTYEECKELLRSMGVACVDSTGMFEAEALASSMVLNGMADYVASEDTDVVIYGAPLLRNLTSRNTSLTIVSGTELRSALELEPAQFIDFALLLGTDFTQRIKNVGPARALWFIRQHKSIERVVETETKYLPKLPEEEYFAEVEAARRAFQTLPPVPDVRLLEQEKDVDAMSEIMQRSGLGRFLMAEEWNYEDALAGNYFSGDFGDDPAAS